MNGNQNPLLTGEPFEFGAWNLRARSSTTKDGPRYHITLEVERDVYQDFMDASHAVTELELQGRAVVS